MGQKKLASLAYEKRENWGGQIKSTDLYNLWTKIIYEDCFINCIGPQPSENQTPIKDVPFSLKNGQNNDFFNNFEPQLGPSGINTYTSIPTSTEKRQNKLAKFISPVTNGGVLSPFTI